MTWKQLNEKVLKAETIIQLVKLTPNNKKIQVSERQVNQVIDYVCQQLQQKQSQHGGVVNQNSEDFLKVLHDFLKKTVGVGVGRCLSDRTLRSKYSFGKGPLSFWDLLESNNSSKYYELLFTKIIKCCREDPAQLIHLWGSLEEHEHYRTKLVANLNAYEVASLRMAVLYNMDFERARWLFSFTQKQNENLIATFETLALDTHESFRLRTRQSLFTVYEPNKRESELLKKTVEHFTHVLDLTKSVLKQ